MAAKEPSYYQTENVADGVNGPAKIYEKQERYNSAGFTHFIRSNPLGNTFTGKFQFTWDSAETVQTAIDTDQAAQDALNWIDWEFGNVTELTTTAAYFFGRGVAWRAVSIANPINATVIGTPAGIV